MVNMSGTRFGEHAGLPYSRCGRTKASFKGMKAYFDLIMKYMPFHTVGFKIIFLPLTALGTSGQA